MFRMDIYFHFFQTGKHCKTTSRAPTAYKLTYDGCTSVKDFRPKYCSTCQVHRCCLPEEVKTLTVEFECPENRVREMDFMWIKSCICTRECQQLLNMREVDDIEDSCDYDDSEKEADNIINPMKVLQIQIVLSFKAELTKLAD